VGGRVEKGLPYRAIGNKHAVLLRDSFDDEQQPKDDRPGYIAQQRPRQPYITLRYFKQNVQVSTALRKRYTSAVY